MAMNGQQLSNQQADEIFRVLVANGFLEESEKNWILYNERQKGMVYSAEDIVGLFTSNDEKRYSLKPSEIQNLNAILEQAQLPTLDPEAVTPDTSEGGFWANKGWLRSEPTGADVAVSEFIAATDQPWKDLIGGKPGGEDDTAANRKYDNAFRKRLLDLLHSMEIDVSREEFYSKPVDPLASFQPPTRERLDQEHLISKLRDDYDLSEADIELMVSDAANAGLEAFNDYKYTEVELEEIATAEAELTEDEAALERYKAFEILDERDPGKYMWNKDNNRIYETVNGQVVTTEGFIDTEFDGEPDEFEWEAAKEQAPWLGLGLGDSKDQFGMLSGAELAEENYRQLEDVVNNPKRYAAEATRYLPGGTGFLGGFASEYDVETSGGDAAQRLSDNAMARFASGEQTWQESFRDLTRATGESWNARPYYEHDDNWSLFAGKSKEFIGEMQNRLIEAGALDPGDVVMGNWGPAEAAAMEPWLETANGQARRWEDVDFETVKSMYAERSAATRPQRPAFTAPAYRNMDPATMEQSVQSVMRQMLGRDATSNEIADLGGYLSDQHRGAFVADVQAARQEYDAAGRAIEGGEQSGGEVQDIDFEARFVQQFETSHNAELERMKRTEQSSERQNLIGNQLNNLVGRLGGGF